MENYEKAELIVKKTGVSLEKANNALKASDYDVLEAMVYLEKLGEINGENIAKYSTGIAQVSEEFDRTQDDFKKSCKSGKFGSDMKDFGTWIKNVINKGCETSFVVTRKDTQIISLPVIVFVLLIIFAFWIAVPLIVVGFFFECRYQFEGFENTTIDINDVCNKTCDKATEVCESIKKEMKKENKDNSDNNDVDSSVEEQGN